MCTSLIWVLGFDSFSKGYAISPTLFQNEQLSKIFELCGSPDENNWPGVTKMPWFNNFKPSRPLKRRVREFFGQ